jgi:methyl-accepting chemotaxis protein
MSWWSTSMQGLRKLAGPPAPWRRWVWPLAVSLLAALPLFDGVGTLGVLAWLGVTAVALAWARTPQARADDGLRAAEPPPAAPQAEAIARLLPGVLPVWLSHLESVRAQTEQAIDELVRSFGSISGQFEAAGFVASAAADANGRQTTFSLLTLCERQLRPVVASMHKILDSKVTLVACIDDLATATKELQGMAQDVSQIAAHTNILAINAAIEAAHAGDAGRGFGVIAKAIRELSQTSADAGRRIAQRMAQIESIMVTTLRKANETAEHDGEAIELSGSVVQDVLAHVRTLGESAEDMLSKGLEIRRDTDNLLVNLQFQDRTSQILGAIDWDIKRLQDAVSGEPAAVPAPDHWLAELSQRYTMDDQRQAAGGKGAAAPAAAAEIEFF